MTPGSLSPSVRAAARTASASRPRPTGSPWIALALAASGAGCLEPTAIAAEQRPELSSAPQHAQLAPASDVPRSAATAATLSGTLSCNLEYERFAPTFLTLPQVSFSQPLAVVAAQGVVAANGTYQLVAQINPAPTTNLSFQVTVNRVSTGKDISYLVLPAPTLGGDFLFESGTRITTVTVGGVAYDHLRTYCSLTP